MKNPLAVALGHSVKRSKMQYMASQGLEKIAEGESAINHLCCISPSTLRAIEAANYVPSPETLLRMCNNEVFNFDYPRLAIIVMIIGTTGKQIEDIKRLGQVLHRIVRSINHDEELMALLTGFISLLENTSLNDKTLSYNLINLGLVQSIETYLSATSSSVSSKERTLKYKSQFATLDSLNEIYNFGNSLVGDSHIDLPTLKRRFNINSQIITCIYSDNDDSGTQLTGYYILYPLNLDAFTDIVGGTIINGRGIQDHHICSSFMDASALYIGMLGGLNRHASAQIIDAMLKNLSALLSLPKLKAIFTRGATNDGKRVVNKYGFQKLADPSEISCIFVNEESLSNSKIKTILAYR